MLDYLWLIPLLPLASAFLLGVAGRRLSQGGVSLIGVGSAGLSFGVAVGVAAAVLELPAESFPILQRYFTWLAAGPFRIEAAFYLDQLSLVMILVVTGVGFLIHVYSIGYMAHEGGYYRFFAYLNLFMFFMLLLVLAGNYVLLFVGWEGVGLCSYLLIGFYFLRQSAADAGKKAFIVNRIGDFGFTLGLLLMFWTFGSLDFSTVFERAGAMPVESAAWGEAGVLTAISLLLLAGATGKSAQIPLYVWLPDAMEGPTPVSALIHAATMVAAGVYMVARSHVLFAHAPFALIVVAVVGCLTAFYAATIGLVQTDIKRVLAYSTVSQLGYMFLGLGVGAFAAGIFHLMTHAFFKALLFLAAGSVIHAMSGEQDIRKMGDLRQKIPATYWTFLLATLAITGMPGFSGFFSKDEILWQAFSSPSVPFGWLLWLAGLLAAVLTSFYMFRLVFLTFHGHARYILETAHHIHESPPVMTGPLMVLAALSTVGGWVGIPAVLGEGLGISNWFEHFLEPVFSPSTVILRAQEGSHSHSEEMGLMGLAVVLALAGLAVAYAFYIRNPELANQLAEIFRKPYQVLVNKYYVDELYNAAVVQPLYWLSERVFWQVVDVGVVDGAVNGTASRAQRFGQWARLLQSGNTRSYGAWVVVGALAILSYFVSDYVFR
ncbi:MAG: NADH-quinone oxidoreductase subunit L [Acidobacteria bacterium]|nr:NADH-quinone oxidoreductase subunit L [Acidobacteriota bacterium]